MATIIKQISTISGDTFDIIAQREYGNCMLIGPLIDANLDYANVMFFDQGVTINIPEVTIAPAQIAGPPWSPVFVS
jgi:phage tail protein X